MADTELILGGQKSGKSRRAEAAARDWLHGAPGRDAVIIVTGQPYDDEMRERIVRHQRDRAARVPGLRTVEAPLQLAQAIAAHSTPSTLVITDCLTLWLTNWLMPAQGSPRADEVASAIDALEAAVRHARGPLLLVGNEIGLGVIPMGRDVRAFVDALGGLNQRMAAASARVVFMAAGLPLVLKGQA